MNKLSFAAIKAIRHLNDSEMTAIVLSLAYKHPEIFSEIIATLAVEPGMTVIEYTENNYMQTFRLTSAQFNEIYAMGGGQKIAAIKAFRAATNAGLKEAKDIIEFLAYRDYIPRPLLGGDNYLPSFAGRIVVKNND
jgi:ribosomal protein L7/L12